MILESERFCRAPPSVSSSHRGQLLSHVSCTNLKCSYLGGGVTITISRITCQFCSQDSTSAFTKNKIRMTSHVHGRSFSLRTCVGELIRPAVRRLINVVTKEILTFDGK